MKLSHWATAPLLLTVSLSLSSCRFGDFGEGLGGFLSCLIDFPDYAPVRSDDSILRAAVECPQGSDCVDSRTLHQGAELEFVIEVRDEISKGELSVRSEPEGLLEITGFSSEPKACSEGREISGTVTFNEVGEGALVVLADGEEVDRFTVDVQAPANLELQTLREGAWSRLDPAEELSVRAEIALRAVVRGSSGDRLVGGPAATWTVSDASVVSFENNADQIIGSTISLFAVYDGQATVEASVGDLDQELPVRVGTAPGMGGSGN